MQKTPWLFVDLDGTLIDTLPSLRSVFFEFGKKAGITLTKDDFTLCNGLSICEVIVYLKEKFYLPDSLEKLENFYHEKLRKVQGKFRPRPYAKTTLKKLRAQGWKCALVTSARKSYAVDFLRRNGMSELFDVLACGDEIRNGKPNPEIYELAKKRAGSGYFIALEDSENGIQAAKDAGCIAIRFEAGNTEGFFSVSSFRDLPKRLDVVDGCPLLIGFPSNFVFQTLADGKPTLPSATLRSVDELWGKAKKQNPSLYDGQVFVIEEERASYTFSGFFSPYRYIHYQLTKKRYLGFIPCGVTGVVCLRGKTVLARRSKQVIGNVGLFEFAPSGTVEKSLGSEIDCKKHVLKELEEELGVPREAVVSLRPVCLVLDLADKVLDVIYWVLLKDSAELRIDNEHTEFFSVSPKRLRELVSKNPDHYTSLVKFIAHRNLWAKQ